MEAILEAIQDGRLDADVKVVLIDVETARALEEIPGTSGLSGRGSRRCESTTARAIESISRGAGRN